ncbi:depupylase/deamidase Dop [Dermabacteraceae bacterium P13138]
MITTRRVMGIETEFGVLARDESARAREGASASVGHSHHAVAAYALLAEEGAGNHRVRWDYGDENPLRDARGFEMQRASAHPTQLTHEVADAHTPSVDLDAPVQARECPPEGADADTTLHWAHRHAISNAVLRNGARLYVDHAHPEYSGPEVMTAREAALYDSAGDEIARRAMDTIADTDTVAPVVLYKNNTDGKGASYGTHENYLLARDIPFTEVIAALTPFFVARSVICGAGRVGIGQKGQESGYQISSRADFFEAEVGLETTLNRPIINTRDEPHALASEYRRLHVIVGDANTSQFATYLKLGITSLVLAALEKQHRTGEQILPRIVLADPVAAMHTVSHDLSLKARLPLRDGGDISALGILADYLWAVGSNADITDPETRDVLEHWEEIVGGLSSGCLDVSDRVEWLAKLNLLQAYRQRGGLDWDAAQLRAIDIQFSDLRRERSLAAKLAAAGRLRTLFSDDEVARAVTTPPASTRAYLRGELISRYRESVDSAGWDRICVSGSDGALRRLSFLRPEWGSREWCEQHAVPLEDGVDAMLSRLAEIAQG